VYEADGSKVVDRICTLFFRDQDNCCLIKKVEIGAAVVVEGVGRYHDVMLDD